jgi:hypothetical protein
MESPNPQLASLAFKGHIDIILFTVSTSKPLGCLVINIVQVSPTSKTPKIAKSFYSLLLLIMLEPDP